MAFIPCPIHVNCPPGLGSLEFDAPLANFSSEAPDPNLFTAINYGQTQTPPNLGCSFVNSTAVGVCSNTDPTQAELCAVNQQLVNLLGTWTCPGVPPPPPPNLGPQFPPIFPVVPQPPPIDNPVPPPPPLFFNTLQTCPFICPDGLPFVWTVAAGQISQTTQALANAIAKSIACQQASVHFMCLSGLTASGCSGAAYSGTITCEKGIAVRTPLSYSIVSGALPPGLVTAQSTDSLSFFVNGTPTTPGTYNFTVQVTDANGNFMQKPYTIGILGISNIGSLPNAMENTPYNVQLNGVGGTTPFTFSLISGTPPGISLSASGLLSGTPNYVTAGSYPISVQITDANGNHCTQNGTIKVTLRPGPDWTQLVWSQYVFNQSGLSTVSGVAIQNITSGQLNRVGADNCSISPAAAAGVFYAGPQVTARVILTISTNCGCGIFDPQNTFAARVKQDGVQIGGDPANPCGNGVFTSGVYTVDFIVSATAGSNFTIDDASPGNKWAQLFNTVPGNLSFTWAIVNV